MVSGHPALLLVRWSLLAALTAILAGGFHPAPANAVGDITVRPAAEAVRLFEHHGRRGQWFVPKDQQVNFRHIDCGLFSCKNWNDRVSSLYVPAYTCVTLFEHIGYRGHSREYCGENRALAGHARSYDLDSFWNDRASSSWVVGRVELPALQPPSGFTFRTYNVFAEGAAVDRGGFPPLHKRLQIAGPLMLADSGEVGITGLQEAGDRPSDCPRSGSVLACLASAVERYSVGAQPRYARYEGIGIVWDDREWENIGFGLDRAGLPVLQKVYLLPRVQVNAFRWDKQPVLAVRLRHRASGRVLRVFDTHLAADSSARGSRRALRGRQVQALVRIVDAQNVSGELPPVVLGDFNFKPDEEPENAGPLFSRFELANERGSVDQIWLGRPEHFRRARGRHSVVRRHGVNFPRWQVSDHASPAVTIAPPVAETVPPSGPGTPVPCTPTGCPAP